MKKKVTIVIAIILIILICFAIFYYKVQKSGNNIINKTAEGIQEYILNINSYKATAEITVESNKNTNRYIVKQEFKSPNLVTQEVLEPSNIKGLKIIYDGQNLKIENTNLNLTTLYEKYEYVADNVLFLTGFIEEYKSNPESQMIEENNEIILKTKNTNSKYLTQKNLYIDKNTAKPIKMEIKSITQNNAVYILYNEIEINNI